MTAFAVFGDRDAPAKLLRATLDDLLDTHNMITPEDDFWLVVGVRRRVTPALEAVMEWCDETGIYYEVVAAHENTPVREGASEWKVSPKSHMRDVVDRVFGEEKDKGIVLALVGDEDPPVDVTRALVRAADSHMVIRDLAEGALTFIRFHGDPVEEPAIKENPLAEEEAVEVLELGAQADEGDELAQEALQEAAVELDLDPDDSDTYPTWADLAAAIDALLGDEEGAAAEEEEEEEPEEEAVEESAGGWTVEQLKGLTIKEVREHARASGVEGYKTMTRPDLIKALIAGTSAQVVASDEEEVAPPAKAPAKKAEAPTSIDVDALADAIIKKLAEALSR
jgi:hypothetical protein